MARCVIYGDVLFIAIQIWVAVLIPEIGTPFLALFLIPALLAGFVCGVASARAEGRRASIMLLAGRLVFIMLPAYWAPPLYFISTHVVCWLFFSSALLLCSALNKDYW